MGCSQSTVSAAAKITPVTQKMQMLETTEHDARVKLLADYIDSLAAVYPYTVEKVHARKRDAGPPHWLHIGDNVLDVTSFLGDHPPGPDHLLNNAGRDATKSFNMIHSAKAKEMAKRYIVGAIWRPPVNKWADLATVPIEAQERVARKRIIADALSEIEGFHPFTMTRVKEHSKGAAALWMVIDGRVLDVTKFAESGHPGGPTSLIGNSGKDASRMFNMMHSAKAKSMVDDFMIGRLWSSPTDKWADLADLADRPSGEASAVTVLAAPPPVAASAHAEINADDFKPIRICCVETLTSNTKLIQWEFMDKDFILPIIPGGHVAVQVPAAKGAPQVSRSYSPMAITKGKFACVVKHYPEGRGSGLLHDAVVGDSVGVRGPIAPLFSLADTVAGGAKRLLLVAGGTGAAPMLAIARQAVVEKTVEAVHLLLCFSTSADALLVDESVTLQALYPGKVAVDVAFSRESAPAKPLDRRHTGRVSAELIRKVMIPPSGAGGASFAASVGDIAVVCGPPGFNRNADSVFRLVGFGDGEITVME